MPAPATIKSPWWSYEIGLIHFLAMSSEHNFTVGSDQYKFLENDLQSINRTRTPWVLFTGHRSMYVDSGECCGASSDYVVMQELQENIEPLLYKYQVNLAFAGYFHNLQRQAAIYQNQTVKNSEIIYDSQGEKLHYYKNPNATVWMVIGSAGNGPDFSDRNYSWSEAYWNNVYGYSVVSAINSTTLSWKLYQSSDNKLIDNVLLTQDFSAWSPLGPDTNGSSSDSLNLGLILGFSFGVCFVLSLGIFGTLYYFRVSLSGLISSKKASALAAQDNPDECNTA